MEVTEAVLENGLTVLIRESHAAPVASCWSFYRVGARNERAGITGVSHWVEHLTFKGTEQLREGDIFRLTARHGGANNGFTSDDFTYYYETLPTDQLDVALTIESQRMAYALFDSEETERERTVILAEREGSENNPRFELSERMGEAVFRAHPYRWPIIGRREDLERLTRDELFAHYRTYYAPNNAVLVIAGDVEPERTLDRVRRYFAAIPSRPAPPAVEAVEPEQQGERRVEVRRPGAAAYLNVAYRAPAARHADTFPLLVLDAVLSGGKAVSWSGGGYMGRSARLYQALVETRLAVSAGSGFRLSVDPYVFSASLTLRDGAAPEAAEAALAAAVEGVAKEPPTRDELARAVRQAEAQFAYGREGVTSQGFALGYFHMHGHWSDLDRHVQRLRAVTPEDVARVAAAYLRPENRTVGWFIPSEEQPSAVSRQPSAARPEDPAPRAQLPDCPIAQLPNAQGLTSRAPKTKDYQPKTRFEREVLSNGIILLRNESRETPAVSIRGWFSAGAVREPVEQAGLAEFTARLLRRGTRQRSAREIAAAVEDLGATFNVWAGTEGAGFSARCLGRDLEAVLDVLGEVLASPSFPETEIEKTRGEILTRLREQDDSTRARAERAVYAMLYPAAHPYARPSIGARESVETLGAADFRAFHAAWYRPQGMIVSVAGAADGDRLRACLERWLPGLPAPGPLADWRVLPSGEPKTARFPMPHKSQMDIIIGGPGIPRDHPDFYSLWMVNVILGGLGLMGRLGERVRQQGGMAYHASCRAISRKWAGEWLASAAVAPENADRAIQAILTEVRRVREELVSDEEFADASDYLIGSTPLRLETNEGIAAYLLNAEYYGLGLDYVHRVPGYIRAETRQTLREAARKHMDPEQFSIAMAGPE